MNDPKQLEQVCDAFNVPPHLIDPTYPRYRTWQLRRLARIIRRKAHR